MGFISKTLLIVILVILVLMFLPKNNGTVICFGCEDKICSCFGFGNETCYGIPYDCEDIIIEEENPNIKISTTK